jgi:hypothetical protein
MPNMMDIAAIPLTDIILYNTPATMESRKKIKQADQSRAVVHDMPMYVTVQASLHELRI